MKKRFFLIFVLFLTGCGWSRFSYGLDALEPNDQSAQATPLEGSVNATINPKDWTDYYKFDAAAGEKIRFTMLDQKNNNTIGQIELLNLNQGNNTSQSIWSSFVSGPNVVVELTKGETYFLRVSGNADSWEGVITGINDQFTQLEYSLSLERNPTQAATIKF
jgi:hypothetical protein